MVHELASGSEMDGCSFRHAIKGFRITRYVFPRDRVIGDSQVEYDTNNYGALELFDNDGEVGLGFFFSNLDRFPSEDELIAIFDRRCMPAMMGKVPHAALNEVASYGEGKFDNLPCVFHQAIGQALWDLAAKHAGMPLFRYLGGKSREVSVYASGCDFPLSDYDLAALYERFKNYGCSAYKVKVGHPDVEWDVRRLMIVRDIVGNDATIMIDANEAWDAAQAIRRVHAYKDAGFAIEWTEDPVRRDDIEGMKLFRKACPETKLNGGEYLDIAGKLKLVQDRAIDILNIHGDISAAMRLGWVCAESGMAISLGNTPMEIGAQICAGLPTAFTTEVSFHNTDAILACKYEVQNGTITLPETPGHGLQLCETARHELRRKGD